jgi:hypothetical protein
LEEVGYVHRQRQCSSRDVQPLQGSCGRSSPYLFHQKYTDAHGGRFLGTLGYSRVLLVWLTLETFGSTSLQHLMPWIQWKYPWATSPRTPPRG